MPRFVLVGAVVLALCGTGYAGYRLALQKLLTAVEVALGPRAKVGALRVGWSGVEIERIVIRAEHGASKGGWPAADELRAERIHIVPALSNLWRSGWQLQSITVEGGYLSALRTQGGRLRLLPSLLETSTPTELPTLAIGELRLVNAALELHDASIRQPPYRLRIEQLQVHAGPLQLPALDTPLQLDLSGVLKGVRHDGRIEIAGELTPSTRDARLDVRLSGVDLLVLQPYLIEVADAGVRRGRLDLSLQANVAKNRLHAPGVVTLVDLELSSAGGVLSRFAGVSRQAVLAAMRRDGRIRVQFSLDGRLDDPAFSLNENIATRIASGMAESLGVSVRGVVQGAGDVLKGLLGR